MKLRQQRPQADTTLITINSVIRSRAFVAGVEDIRGRRPPRFDRFSDDWGYERGRQWAVLAPRTMPLRIGRKVNPDAISVYLKGVL